MKFICHLVLLTKYEVVSSLLDGVHASSEGWNREVLTVFKYSVYLVISTVLRSDSPLCFILYIRTFSFINPIVPILLSLDSLLTIFLTSSSCTSGNILKCIWENQNTGYILTVSLLVLISVLRIGSSLFYGDNH